MSFSPVFLSAVNFRLAFTRITRGSNKQYKHFFSHLYPTFQASLDHNLDDLSDDIKRRKYEPTAPTLVYFPKRTGVLRPIGLLCLKDQVVYQAIVNIVANAFRPIQQTFALSRSFGGVLAPSNSPFFYRSWKSCYASYNREMAKAFRSGKDYVADFDLVSFYELIDHFHLRRQLESRLKNPELIDLLFKCLEVWSTRNTRSKFHHGIPQGPEASTFLAECFLFGFDVLRFREVTYLRYIDDIRILSIDEIGARRALLKLDLAAKDVGLVPQAQKIELRRVRKLQELQKKVPSALLEGGTPKAIRRRQKPLLKMLRASLRKEGGTWNVNDVTKFKFALRRLNRRRDVLRRISALLISRPDLSWTLSAYYKKFAHDQEAAGFLLAALRRDPTYDAAAADYIDAMHICEPAQKYTAYRRVIQTAQRRSEEKSVLLRIAAMHFRGYRSGPTSALQLIAKQSSPIARGILLHRLFTGPVAAYQFAICRPVLEEGAKGVDEDLARFCAWNLFAKGGFGPKGWKPDRDAPRSVKLLALGLGLRARLPRRPGVLEHFAEKQGVKATLPWKKALGLDFQQAEVLCINLRGYLVGSPDPIILSLDSLNDLLIQNFSKKHPVLVVPFTKAAKKKSNPDFGQWLNNSALAAALPQAIFWLRDVHQARRTPLAHPKHSSGAKKGKPTRSVSFQKAKQLMDGLPAAWTEILREWRKVL